MSVVAQRCFDESREPATVRNGDPLPVDAPSLPVFQQAWWIDTAAKMSRCTTILAIVQGQTIGSLTYVVHRNKIGSRLGLAPFWSHLGGPVLAPFLDRDRQREAIRQIARQLPANVSFRFACDPNSGYADIVAEEFAAAGFTRDHDPTYLHAPQDDDVYSRMKARHRAHIRAAQRAMTIVAGDAGRFVRFYEDNLVTPSHSPCRIARDLLDEGIRRGRAIALFAVRNPSGSQEGETDAAIACVWDERRYYYWMSTRRRSSEAGERKPNADATKMLILAAMQHARTLGLVFDADSPESAGGRALFHTVFGLDRVEQRIILSRPTRLTALYDRMVPRVKTGLKAIFPKARIYDPRASLRNVTAIGI